MSLILLQPLGAAWGPPLSFPSFPPGGSGAAALSPRSAPRDLDQAADAAIEHKSEAEMNFVLSKCTPSTDASVVEKLNRARAQLLKK